MSTQQADPLECAESWIRRVADGSLTMSQRRVESVLRYAGSVDLLGQVAVAHGVHLLLLEDDEGQALVAASTKPFTVLC